MKIQDGKSYFELEVTEKIPPGTQNAGDTRFSVRVCMADHETTFSAESWAWVDGRELAGFVEDLRRLDEAREGSSGILSAQSPNEFRMEIRSTDHAGHMGVFGWVAHHCYGGLDGPHLSRVTFGIPFCPSELPRVVREFERLSAFFPPLVN